MTRRNLLICALLAATGVTALFAQPKTAPQLSAPAVNPPADASAAQIQRGLYLVQLGDCVACHTLAGGARFAGGRPVETPFGRLLSANITPDMQTGIGRYTPDTFYRALHEGIDAEGRHLYPAFPYNYYTQITREDTDAMFAYLRSILPVRNAVDRNQLPFPFNIRQLLTFWNWMFLDRGPYRAQPARSAQWNRGAYLVEGLGHCQACHTPKNLLGGPKRSHAFEGGAFAEWFAPDLTANPRSGLGSWNDAELREFLQRGLNAHSAASGEMGEVVAFSTSWMNDSDSDAILAYLRSIPASPARRTEAAPFQVMKQGEAIWQDQCSACHRMDGSGVPGYFPPMRGDANVQQSDPTTVLHFVLAGTSKVATDRAPTQLSMPAFHWKLSDQQVAAVITYIRNSWGNAAAPVSSRDVARLRGHLELRAGAHEPAPTDLGHPGAGTLGVADTDSRANGTPQAGRPVPANAADTQPLGSSSSATSGSGQQSGHPAGVPTGGPG